VDGGAGWQHKLAAALQEADSDEIVDRTLDGVLGSCVLTAAELPLDLGSAQLDRVLEEDKGKQGALDSGVPVLWPRRRIGAAVRRVLISHEEVSLLVVRPSVGVDAPPGAASWSR